MLNFHFLNPEESKELYEKYVSGEILNKELKDLAIAKVRKFLEEHQEKRKNSAKILDKFLLKTKIESILN